MAAEPGKRMRSPGGTSHCNPGGKPQPAAKAQDVLAHPPLSAEQMRHSAKVEPYSIRSADRSKRSPAPGGEHREMLQNALVALGIGGDQLQARDQCPRLGHWNARIQPE